MGTDDIYVMFDIQLEGARKVITVHSALIIENKLSLPIELVSRPADGVGKSQQTVCVLPTNEVYYIPVLLLRAPLFVRPVRPNWTFKLCDEEIRWADGVTVEETSFVRSCKTDSVNTPFYRLIMLGSVFWRSKSCPSVTPLYVVLSGCLSTLF